MSKVRVKSKKQVLTGKAEERFTEVWVACDYVVKLYMVSIHGSGGRTDDLKSLKFECVEKRMPTVWR